MSKIGSTLFRRASRGSSEAAKRPGRPRLAVLAMALALVVVASAAAGAGTYLWGTYQGFQVIKVIVDGKYVDMPDVPAVLLNGRTVVPLRFVSEALHAQVKWDGNLQTVSITSPVPGAPPSATLSVPPIPQDPSQGTAGTPWSILWGETAGDTIGNVQMSPVLAVLGQPDAAAQAAGVSGVIGLRLNLQNISTGMQEVDLSRAAVWLDDNEFELVYPGSLDTQPVQIGSHLSKSVTLVFFLRNTTIENIHFFDVHIPGPVGESGIFHFTVSKPQ